MPRYRKVVGSKAKLSNERTFCDDDKGAYVCELEPELGLGATETWAYRVRADPRTGCWRAQSLEPYGAYQEDIDAYRNREALAPSRASVRRQIREAERLRSLTGCARRVVAGGDPAKFIAGLAAEGVQREFPGTQKGTKCRAKGKEAVDFGPDSYKFACETRLRDGRRYIDAISCFDPPPYSNYDSCGEDEGYPRKPPRPLP